MRRLLLITILFFAVNESKAQSISQEVKNLRKGIASFYHHKFEGRKTATGEIFDNDKYTAASNTLKLGTFVRVTNLNNGKVVYVRINDRMAPNNKRVIDLATVAADKLGFRSAGTASVKVEVVPSSEGKLAILAQRNAEFIAPANEL
ncbi:MAG: septal ring lytic transglycosylase RlpA family protein [Flavipsychrobacter sp.]|nr:septal ring lytic transglycosylase RlpA family protein [Flavipsychrobacter sp.]